MLGDYAEPSLQLFNSFTFIEHKRYVGVGGWEGADLIYTINGADVMSVVQLHVKSGGRWTYYSS